MALGVHYKQMCSFNESLTRLTATLMTASLTKTPTQRQMAHPWSAVQLFLNPAERDERQTTHENACEKHLAYMGEIGSLISVVVILETITKRLGDGKHQPSELVGESDSASLLVLANQFLQIMTHGSLSVRQHVNSDIDGWVIWLEFRLRETPGSGRTTATQSTPTTPSTTATSSTPAIPAVFGNELDGPWHHPVEYDPRRSMASPS